MLLFIAVVRSDLPPYTNASSVVKSITNSLNENEFVETIHRVYNEIMQRRKTLIKLPSGNAAGMFIRELTSWCEHFKRDSEYKSTTLKV